MRLTEWISSVWKDSGVFGIICILLSFIALINISVSIWLTMHKIRDYLIKNQKKETLAILFYVFTLLGLYAAGKLIF